MEIERKIELIKKRMGATDMSLLLLVAFLTLLYFIKNTEMWNPLNIYIRNQEIGKGNN
jgi:hypothetical protein